MVSAQLPGTPGTAGLAPPAGKTDKPAQTPETSNLLSFAIDENGSHAARCLKPQQQKYAEPE